jgi:nucleotidyltransferase substrate binding protein (TIGR01987 family)
MSESKFELLYKDLGRAIVSFKNALNVNMLFENDVVNDLFVNGQIQKFEYNIELLWKTLKAYFKEGRGITMLYPKEIIKQFFQEQLITEEVYLLLIDALTSRNLLSHVYNEEIYKEIEPKLKDYARAIETAYTAIKF